MSRSTRAARPARRAGRWKTCLPPPLAETEAPPLADDGVLARLRRRAAGWSPTTRGLLWTTAAGFFFCVLNALMRALAQSVEPLQSQFLRYAFGLLVLLPVVLWRGPRHYVARDIRGQFWRGGAHTAGLVLWFLALPNIPLADTTAIGFTGPIFVMIGARLVFGEAMHWERWVATVLGFAGVLIVVGPRLGLGGGAGLWHLVMLASAPMFAASFLITKALTKQETAGVILVWQSITVSVFSLPLAIANWGPVNGAQWLGFLVCGLLGSVGHYCLTRSFAAADISATQSVKFLDLVWAAALGYLFFADVPTETTVLGGALIAAATLWVARREGRRGAAAAGG
ncbi:MAG: DMT family transporter [Rubrivivax sp.]|nr:DMT family transporter [Rubrivivax sp.]